MPKLLANALVRDYWILGCGIVAAVSCGIVLSLSQQHTPHNQSAANQDSANSESYLNRERAIQQAQSAQVPYYSYSVTKTVPPPLM